jgi:hypothetical protein
VKPARSTRVLFSNREIVIFVLVMILAIALTVSGTFYVLKTFVLGGNPNDPLIKAGGLSSMQQRELTTGK